MDWAQYALHEAEITYGVNLDIEGKGKSLSKFGSTTNADNGQKTTIATFLGASTYNETFATTNAINAVISTSGSDTETLAVEGFYYDASNNLVFHSQEVTLTGTTSAGLSQALSRCTRMYVKAGTFAAPASDLVGNIYAYDDTDGDDGFGTPNTATDVRCVIAAGFNQSEKCATSTSSVDYWLINSVTANVTRSGPTAIVDIDVEWRAQGGVWRPLGLKIELSTSALPWVHRPCAPWRLIPPNSDVRAVGTSTADNTQLECSIDGILAKVSA